jgi:hypothetical protein
MSLARFLDFLRHRLQLVVRVGIAVLVVLVALDTIPGFIDREHAHTAAEHLPGFWAVFGLLGCLLLVVFAKTFGHLGISTREDYYDE